MVFPACRLPLEVMYEIIDHLDGDFGALFSCAATCRALLPHSRAFIFREVHLHCQVGEASSWCYPDPRSSSHLLQTFAQLIRRNPTIGSYVRRLKLFTVFRGLDHRPFNKTDIADFAVHLTRVNALTLDNLRVRSMDDFFSIIAFPKLETLHCNFIAINAWEHDDPCTPERVFPQLKELTVRQCMINPMHVGDPEAGNHLGCDSVLPLEHLQISGVQHATEWYTLIGMGGWTLRHLDVAVDEGSTTVAPPSGKPTTNMAVLFTMLQTCAEVRFLRVRYALHSGDTGRSSEGTLLEHLCTFFEGAPPLSRTLEHLSLNLVERDGEMVGVSEALGARLARVLLDRTRFPSFRKLTVRVEVQAWVASFGCWVLPRRLDDSIARGRWSKVFEAFDVDIGITNRGGLVT